ncbi:hypothetical protein SCLCIDRAFT_15580 [Scleroderma citrinum Foug A]|uniref:CxC1-like cysteine cluster associated with KDZ transposases domain-containing protein n=1 Tax=Scleroderma citrinum Foug A TaxID=1036808 RepID=A0A0C3E4R0_9AGAM|nr:hypothetical protein SCLCIDRAFT_15580 [Scleroderma citrinum Foug A]
MPHHQYPNEVLLCHGYLGSAPIYPMVAISIHALALFHQAHRACPRYSIQSFCKTLCYIHQVPYRAYLTTQLSAAYDIYLEILHNVDRQLKKALGRDMPDCLKRWDSTVYGTTPRLDTRCPRLDYWIDAEAVNKFKHEVNSMLSDPYDAWEDEHHRKQMFSVFHESGIFIAVCRHQFILLACDMIKSGEL